MKATGIVRKIDDLGRMVMNLLGFDFLQYHIQH